MSANIIKGMPIAEEIRKEIIQEAENLKSKGIEPKLAVVLVGGDPASIWYAKSKIKVGDKVGVKVELTEMPENTKEDDLIKFIEDLNNDKTVHGILVELPLPKHIAKEKVMNAILPVKDVDGVTAVNRGYIFGGQDDLALIPATPLSCIELIQRSGIELKGKRVALIGRGDTVGRPLASLLITRHATITVCHTRTVDIASITKNAEIIVAAAGRKGLVTKEMVSPGTVVIDAGINEITKEDGSTGIVGDVDFEAVKEVAAAITPVPGGVGSLTTTIIMGNVLKAIKLQGLV
jgi:methylenetetrahydrofolate dehydrogenase (NADP+)/methenyltetrahydrofolate cyclohydrolase